MRRRPSEVLHDLTIVAGQIAIETPPRPNKWVSEARVRWDLVLKLRHLLEELGFDLVKARELAKASEDARRQLKAIEDIGE